MEALLGSVLVIAMSFGYTEVKMRKHQKEYTDLVGRVDVMEQNLGRNMLSAMVPMSRAIKELQETVGGR
jgi:hypothetical protein